jgi:hypothetical protein
VFYEDQVIRRVNAVVHQLHTPAAHQLTRRPFRINWFINQLTMCVSIPFLSLLPRSQCTRGIRCLVLWDHDPTLDDALKLGKSILMPIDVLNALWPCPCTFHCLPSSVVHLALTMYHSPAIQQRCDSLRQRLTDACTSRNIDLPYPSNVSVPDFIRS